MISSKLPVPKGIRGKLIVIFVLIKILPLALLAWFAWYSAQNLGQRVATDATNMADNMLSVVKTVGDSITQDAIRALDQRSREAIESLTTETAHQLATFLYERDEDILSATLVEPTESGFRAFLEHRRRNIYQHGAYRLSATKSAWIPVLSHASEARITGRISPDNSKEFHSRPPEYLGKPERRPLFVEMTYVGLDGKEKVKVTTNGSMTKDLQNVADKSQTFIRAEDYWSELKKLKPGQIYVSDVIGAYVPSKIIGAYTPASAAKAGMAFEPEKSAYAGAENPVGKRFRGIVRWATPVVRNGTMVGYVTLALDHDHIRQFSDRLMPTEARYTPIADASQGNYAFIWDSKGRAISHPRDYFIVGYDPQTGRPVIPWLDETLYQEWRNSGLPSDRFLADVKPFHEQSLTKKPATAMVRAGTVALDCRYLNFSPQCEGWKTLTEHGGSGSFVIFFSGLWKLTTAAAIPYYTGQYGHTEQGFGFVTIGANVDDFHEAATKSGERIALLIAQKGAEFKQQRSQMVTGIGDSLTETSIDLAASTLAMVVIVVLIAILIANFLTTRITRMISGIRQFETGNREYRLDASARDEMGDLARSFNTMADSVAESFRVVDEARLNAEEANRMLESIAHYDAVTGLPNRVLLSDRLQQAIVQCQRRSQSLAVAYLDLDSFKPVNDRFGHDVGDKVLSILAHRMKAVLREGDTLARIGGDEFVAVLIDLNNTEDCEPLLARILQVVSEAVVVETGVVQVSASIGLTIYPRDGVDADQLLRHADQAMYVAKQAGKNRYHLFDVDHDAATSARRETLGHIRDAMQNREFVLHYQPQVNMRTGAVVGAEALIRWQHPQRGMLPPAAFLPIIEDHAISVELGDWVIDTALTQAAEWHAAGLMIPVSVNVGALQLQQSDFATRLSRILATHPDVPPSCLKLEVVETSALEDVRKVSELMHACRKIGVLFALDDFGTGYSSLTYLKRLPVDTIKIDQSFVRDMLDDADDFAIVQSVVGLAATFHRNVIAEGVETVAHGALLIPIGCELAQGYGIARPMPGEQLPGWAATWRPDAAWTTRK